MPCWPALLTRLPRPTPRPRRTPDGARLGACLSEREYETDAEAMALGEGDGGELEHEDSVQMVYM